MRITIQADIDPYGGIKWILFSKFRCRSSLNLESVNNVWCKKCSEKKSKKMISLSHYEATSKSASDCHQFMPNNRHFVLNCILFILIVFYFIYLSGKSVEECYSIFE